MNSKNLEELIKTKWYKDLTLVIVIWLWISAAISAQLHWNWEAWMAAAFVVVAIRHMFMRTALFMIGLLRMVLSGEEKK